ncbi:MAG: hypothetical protein JRC86_01945 [Deltaproteobacteria bacterium]|nr:hypothetical protein [Deltaproteobacteria bacterium]
MAKEEKKSTSTDVATQKAGGAVAGFDYGERAGEGFEGTTSDDLSIPFLSILQSNSPQIVDEDPAGAKAGMLFNTVTRELFNSDNGLIVIPVHKDMAFVEWVPRGEGDGSGGGFVGLHVPDSDVVKAAIEANGGSRIGKLKLENKNELVETHYVYCLILDAEGKTSEGFAVLSFTSTKIKPQRDWFTAMYTIKGRPPLYANRAVMRTVKQENKHGKFFNFRIDPFGATWKDSLIDPSTSADLLNEAVSFRKMVTSGMAKAAHDTERAATGTGKGTGEDGEEPPF